MCKLRKLVAGENDGGICTSCVSGCPMKKLFTVIIGFALVIVIMALLLVTARVPVMAYLFDKCYHISRPGDVPTGKVPGVLK